MTTFDRYLLMRFLHVFLVAFVSLFGLYVVIDAFTNFEDFLETPGGPIAIMLEVARYYSYRISMFIDKIGGFVAIISAMVTFSLLQRYGELNPLLSAGIPTYRLVTPVLCGALLIDGVMSCNREFLIPRIAHELQTDPGQNKSTKEQVEPAYDVATMINIDAKKLNVATQAALDADFILPGQGISEQGTTLRSKEAIWKPGTRNRPNGWLLTDARRDFEDQPVDYEKLPLTKLGRKVVRPGPNPGQLFIATDVGFDRLFNCDRNFEFVSTWELMRRIRSPSFTTVSLRKQSLHLHSRIVRPLMDMLTVLLGLPLVARRGGQALITNLAVCAGVLGGVVGIEQGFGYLGAACLVAPDFAAWAPVIITGTLSAWVREYVKT